MKHFTRLIVVLLVLVAFTSIASAARPQPEPFTTTGYTDFSSAQSEFLPGNYAKFHFKNLGGDAVDNDALCQVLYGYPCDLLCLAFGQACGVSGYLTGSFSYDEWGLTEVDLSTNPPTAIGGANHGRMLISTSQGNVDLRFAGSFNATGLWGGFEFLGGTDAYKGIKGSGTKAGVPGYVFSVVYIPCEEGDSECLANRCAAYGSDLKLKKDRTQWDLSNEGEQPITISKVKVFWPADGPQLTQVKLAGKAIFTQPLSAPIATIDGGWSGDAKDREIKAGQRQDLWLEFAGDISQNPWDFTILVEFEGGCAVPFVAFPPSAQ